ncbi:aminopeptidase P family protein [uncultured Eubacterium sp.]|uniref:aminopeptidase P family protein n=1 Tax=uncultured Eubacterium sp. TaxID=165185 RepID=UPI002673A3EC|nr:aminopeptidase P family protein [uncultured Eubacterium sp.]
MNINNKLRLLREEMARHNIDIYIVPTCDFHGSEEIGEFFQTRKYMSGFTGSAGTLVVTKNEALLWTDGRYFVQAKEQLAGTEIRLMKSGQKGVLTIREYIERQSGNIGFDGRMMSAHEAEGYRTLGVKINSDLDLVGKIWKDRPGISCEKIWILEEQYAGKTAGEKITEIRERMKAEGVEVLLITALDETAWILNLRGNDIKCSPVFMSFMLLTMKESIVFCSKEALGNPILEYLKHNDIEIKDYDEIYGFVESIRNSKIWLDKSTANDKIINVIHNSNTIMDKLSPALKLKAVKNKTEIKNMKKAHILDGIAMTKFIYWLKSNVGKQYMDELLLGKKLEEFRSVAESYLEPSFPPIVGYREHGAIVHYSATEKTNYRITDESMVLIDSGGHYLEGTTDITRTISLGNATDKMKKMYTAVLKGHLNLLAAVFKKGCTGVSLDYIARKPLWDMGMDYNHGTGHGVGYLLNVHEAPNALRYRMLENSELNAVFEPGMVTSNEPGVYLEGEFGIRIENLIVCQEKETNEYGEFLEFETLTYVPYDMELIDESLMSEEEIKLLHNYHKKVYEKISPYLDSQEKEWLQTFVTY